MPINMKQKLFSYILRNVPIFTFCLWKKKKKEVVFQTENISYTSWTMRNLSNSQDDEHQEYVPQY